MKTGIRLLISAFILVLIGIVCLGVRWWGLEGPKPPPHDGRPVLVVGVLAGLVGLWAIWRKSPGAR